MSVIPILVLINAKLTKLSLDEWCALALQQLNQIHLLILHGTIWYLIKFSILCLLVELADFYPICDLGRFIGGVWSFGAPVKPSFSAPKCTISCKERRGGCYGQQSAAPNKTKTLTGVKAHFISSSRIVRTYYNCRKIISLYHTLKSKSIAIIVKW